MGSSTLLMVDFSKYLSDEAKQRMAHHEDEVKQHREMPLEELVTKVDYYLMNYTRCQWLPGEPVYDAVMWHTLIPEMLRRLKNKEEDK